MTFKKLALAAAVAAVPAVGFSMEAIEDATLSDMTGQDGITIDINTPTAGISSDIYIHDKDGFKFSSYSTAGFTTSAGQNTNFSFGGAIVIEGMNIGAGNTNAITLDIDAGDDSSTLAGNAPILNIKVTLPSVLTINTGSIKVANSQRDVGATTSWGLDGAASSTIMGNMNIKLGSTALNIQLGGEAQVGGSTGTDMIVLGGRVTGGLSITNFELRDSTGATTGGIAASAIYAANAGGTDLDLLADVNVVNTGLEIRLGQVGHVSNGLTVNMADVKLGTTTNAAIGDVSIVGLNLNNTVITVRGHAGP